MYIPGEQVGTMLVYRNANGGCREPAGHLQPDQPPLCMKVGAAVCMDGLAGFGLGSGCASRFVLSGPPSVARAGFTLSFRWLLTGLGNFLKSPKTRRAGLSIGIGM